MNSGSSTTSARYRVPVSQGGIVLGNSLTRASLRGDANGLAVTVRSLTDQSGPGNRHAAASTLTALASTNAASLEARFGLSGALAYLDDSDRAAQFDAIVSGQP
jgi:hypothetical protein